MAKNTNGGGATKYRTAEENEIDRRAARDRKKTAAHARSASRRANGESPKAPTGRPGLGRLGNVTKQERKFREAVTAEALAYDLELQDLRTNVEQLPVVIASIADGRRRHEGNVRLAQLRERLTEAEMLLMVFGSESSTSQSFVDAVKAIRATDGHTGRLVRTALFAAKRRVAAKAA